MPTVEQGELDYLKNKLAMKASRVALRYEYYEMKQRLRDFNISTPEGLRGRLSVTSGWCAKAVDSLADRLVFRGFAEDTDLANLNEIFDYNNPDVLFDSAILSALIGGCSFAYVYRGEDGFPRIQILDGMNATGIIDPVTNLLQDGYAVLERDEYGQILEEAYFKPGVTVHYRPYAEPVEVRTPCPYPALVPIIFRPDAKRHFGHSRISRACMELTQSAMRTLIRSEISAEFYSFPQRYVTGIDPQENFDKWKASMSAMWAVFKRDEDDDSKPTFGQFQQQSMQPHTDHMRMFASMFAGETGLTLDDLGFVTDVPSSAEAIKAAHETMKLTARKAQRTFGSCFLNVGFVASCFRDRTPYQRYLFRDEKPLWEPVFEPDASTMSGLGDAAIKINQALPGYFGAENFRQLTGIEADSGYNTGAGYSTGDAGEYPEGI